MLRYPKTKSSISVLSTLIKSKTLEKVRSATKVRISPYKSELPDADFGDFDTKACEKCHFKRTRNISLPSLPQIPSPSDKSFNSIFLRKIELCETLCDYSNPRNDSFAKEIKKRTLIEISNFLSVMGVMSFIHIEVKMELFNMILINLLRPIQRLKEIDIVNHDVTQFKLDDYEHLEQIYSIMNSVYNEFYNMRLFTADFAIKVSNILYSKDVNERNNCIAFYTRLLANHDYFIRILPYFLKILSFEYERNPLTISTVLEIINECIHKDMTYVELIYPYIFSHFLQLLRRDTLIFYNNSLFSIFDNILSLYTNLSPKILQFIIQIWPTTNPTKEILIYDYLIKSIESINFSQKNLLTRAFYIIGNCINSNGFKIAEKANKSLSKPPLIVVLSRNASLLLPNILSKVESAKSHWSNKVRLAAIETFNIISKYSVDISQWKRNTKVELDRKRSNWINIVRAGNLVSGQELTDVLGKVVKLYKYNV